MPDIKEDLGQRILEEEQLDISIDRVDKLPSPLLVIGLGGTGSSAVHTIKQTLARRFELPKDEHGNTIPVPEQTAYLEIDTSVKGQGSLDASEFLNISIPGLEAILDLKKRDFNLTDYERKWVDRNLNSSASGMGAGTYRQAARFMLSRNYEKVNARLRALLTSIVTKKLGDTRQFGRVEIVIVTGICGGTGSGTFLDIPQIIRHLMASEPSLSGLKYQITGYIVAPDISLSEPGVAGNAALSDGLRMNGYAALKELDFWMNVGEHKTPYSMQYTDSVIIPWTRPPYDACILMSGTTVDGTLYADGKDVVRKSIAENLLHYLASEISGKDKNQNTSGESQYSYIEYEDNLKKVKSMMVKRYPLLYGYRAIGAYFQRIPKKKIIYFEGSLLFSSFLPLRDEKGRLAPNNDLLLSGRALKDAQAVSGDERTLYNNFTQSLPLPSFCMVSSADAPKLEAMRRQKIQPHYQVDVQPSQWKTSTVRPAAIKSARAYLDEAWDRFKLFCTKVINDPKFGPFSLLAYLEDLNAGLLPALQKRSADWDNYSNRFNGDLSNKLKNCEVLWKDFEHPPMLTRRKAIEAYLQALNSYFGAVRRAAFMEEYAIGLRKVVQRASEYVRDALKPLCDDLDKLSIEFGSDQVSDIRTERDLIDMDNLKPQIEQDFNTRNSDSKIVLEFLDGLSGVSFASLPNADSHGTGISFIYSLHGRTNILETLKKCVDAHFGAINGQSLDAIMEQCVGTDKTEQNKYMTTTLGAVMSGAKPLFAQIATISEQPAICSYLSIPDDANAFFDFCDGHDELIPKRSTLHDHIYCLTTWDGLALYKYSILQDLEKTYSNYIDKAEPRMGVHLVWNGDNDSDYIDNWSKLPSPCPFYFFGGHGTPFTERAYTTTHKLTEAARQYGMLDVDAQDAPLYRLHVYYGDVQQTTIQPAQVIADRVQAILSKTMNPATGVAYTPSDKLTMLKALMDESAVITIAPGYKPDCIAPYLGLQNEPLDPNNETIRVDPEKLRQAQENHLLLSNEFAAAIIARQPRLELIIKQQVDGFKAISEAIADIQRQMLLWQPRIEYAETAARMFIFSVLSVSLSGASFKNELGEKTSVVQEGLLKADIKEESPLIKTTGYLADVGPENQIRSLLEHQLRLAENNLVELEKQDRLTAADLKALIDKIDWLTTIAGNELKDKRSALLKQNADAATLNKQIALLNSIVSLCEARKKIYMTIMPA